MQSNLIISVAIPKCASTSMRETLKNHFRHNLLVVSSDPMNTPFDERNKQAEMDYYINARFDFGNIRAIHGHIMPLEYKGIIGATFITFIRNPIDRLISHYWQCQRVGASQSFHQRVLDEKWSFERFAHSEEMRNIYQQIFWGFPPSYFNFIGTIENYSRDFKRLCKILDLPFKMEKLNVSTDLPEIDNDLRKRLEKHHSWDMDLWSKIV